MCIVYSFLLHVSALTEQQYFDIEKRLAESQEQFLSSTRDLQTLKEEHKKISEFSHTSKLLIIYSDHHDVLFCLIDENTHSSMYYAVGLKCHSQVYIEFF